MNNLLDKLYTLKKLIGNTPLYNLCTEKSIFIKAEYYQLGGSIKMRSAFRVIEEAILDGSINEETVVIESTSGNFGIALALICKKLDLKFIPVIDPCISLYKKKKLELLCSHIVQITQKDETGNYLLNRIKFIKNYLEENKNSFQPNQYKNKNCYLAYNTMIDEIKDQMDQIDYIFISVSSGATITGISQHIKKYFTGTKIIAVDIEGSLIFSNITKERRLPGIGASKTSDFIALADIDDHVILTEEQIISGCQKLFHDYGIMVGASGGAAFYAALQNIEKSEKKHNCLIIMPDSGDDYLELIDYKCFQKTSYEIH
ncbi:2,3-diaminopropionate biosynthesis protein SbnA [Flavobacterium sp. CFS9]|uniref:2,3-diaminopropionate biosynthesis protein SbnA n=1 Tax=Flavobacterium sp. CFS9 TaxID=3143118 RepID=A0AAT9H731_9FLAO